MDDYILESDAHDLLHEQTRSSSTDDQDLEQNQAQVYMGDKTKHRDGTSQGDPDLIYEEMVLGGQRYLCEIPRVDSEDTSSTNQTGKANEVDEQRELARATDRGLELLHEMENKCMYYVSGWWSYSFCYKKQIKQFHALPAGGGVPSYPPIEDPSTHSFVLGRFAGDDDAETDGDHKKTSELAELQTKGGTRYLVQRLTGGTQCDLTGKDRKVEVQFHCHPQSTDRIGWIKELTTCSYLMVIHTPRLCNDVAFLPPQENEAHEIHCSEVLAPDEVREWEAMAEYEASQRLVHSAPSEFPVVGGIEVGAQKLVGMEGKVLEKGRVASAGEEKADAVAWREKGKIHTLPKEELKKLELEPEKLEPWIKRVEEYTQGKDWTLEVVETNGQRTLRGVVDPDEAEETESNAKDSGQTGTESKEKETERPRPREPEKGQGKEEAKAPTGQKHEEQREPTDEGSDEVFKDEL